MFKWIARRSYARLDEDSATDSGLPSQHDPQGLSAVVAPLVTRMADRHRHHIWDVGIASIAAAAAIFSIAALCVKLLHSRIPVLQITLIRSTISWLLSLSIARSKGISPIFGSRANLFKLFCRGLFGASAMTAYYVSLQALPLADAVTLFFLNPPLTAVLAWLIRGEPLSITGALGCLASFLGVILLAHPPFLFGGHASWGHARIVGTVAGLMSALLGAAAFISIRYIGRSEPALVVAMWFHTATLMISSVPLAAGWPDRAVLPSLGDAALLVAVALSSFSAQLYLTRGFQLESATRASATNFTQVVYSYAWGALLLHEHITLMGVLGSLLVAVGVITVNHGKKRGPVQGQRQGQGEQQQGVPTRHSMASAGDVAVGQQGLVGAAEEAKQQQDRQQLLQQWKGQREDGGGGVDGSLCQESGTVKSVGKVGAASPAEVQLQALGDARIVVSAGSEAGSSAGSALPSASDSARSSIDYARNA